MNTAVLVGHKGKTLAASLLKTAVEKYPGCYGIAVVLDEDIIIDRENFDPEMDAGMRATHIFNKLADYKDTTKVLWLSKEPVTGKSMQPLTIQEEDVKNEAGEEITVTNIAAVLYGDYSPSKHEGSTETGEYHAHEDTFKPTILEMLGECQGDVDNLRTRLEAEETQVTGNLCDNEDCGALLLFFDDEVVQLAKSPNSGKVVDGYFTTDVSLVVDPASSRGIEASSDQKKRRALGKGSTIREPVSVKGAEAIAAQSGGKVSVLPANQIIKVKASVPTWACGNNSNQKAWYRACNLVRDKQGNGVVPAGNPHSWTKKPEVEVDARVLKATSLNDLALIIKSFSITAVPDNVVKPETATHPVSPPNQRFVKTTSAAEKEAWMKSAIREKLVNTAPTSAADIQAEEKELPTFKTLTGLSLNDLAHRCFEDLFTLITTNPKTATQALWDALHRPLSAAAMASPTQVAGPIVVAQPVKKKRIGGSR